MMFSPTHVKVTVKAGKSLLIKSKSGTNDAYATIEFNKEKFATAPEKSNSPKWMTECTFALPSGGVFHNNVFVTVSVFNKKHGKLGLESDDLIGFANIPLSALNASDSRERCRWHKLVGKKKDSKKERGEVEVAFRFIVKNMPAVNVEKKSPRVSRFLLTGSKNDKGRRRSEDEDSGVGLPISERKKSFIGKSCENLTDLFHSSSRSNGSDKSLNGKTSSVTSATSARNTTRHLSVGNFPESSRAISVEILHDSEANKDASVRRSNSSGNKKTHLTAVSGARKSSIGASMVAATLGLTTPKLGHFRNRSLPDAGEVARSSEQKSSAAATTGVCVNGSHVYISGTPASGQSLVDATNRNRSQSVIALNRLDKQQPMKAIRNLNSSNDNSRTPPASPISTVYKPRNSYRLDVKELMKVSTIPEDQKSSIEVMSHEQLVALATHQQRLLNSKEEHIKELENYIDTLLLKVILVQPQILDKSCRVMNR